MPKLRIPLQADVKNRNDTVVKDSIITNGFVEQTTSNKIYTVKRPGLGFVSQGAGTAQGTFLYNGIVYSWDISGSPTTPLTFSFWNNSTTYVGGSGIFVYADDPSTPEGIPVRWYPVTPILGVPPSEPNWSKELISSSWTLVNTVSFGISSEESLTFSQTASRVYLTTADVTYTTMYAYYFDNVEIDSLTTIGDTPVTYSQFSPNSINNGGVFYNYNSSISVGEFWTLSSTNGLNWTYNSLGGGIDYFDSHVSPIYGNYLYTFPNNSISNSIQRLDWTTKEIDTLYSPTGLPSTGSCYMFTTDNFNIYFVRSSFGATAIYGSDTGVAWTQVGSNIATDLFPISSHFHAGSSYIMTKTDSNVYKLITIPDGGVSYSVEDVSIPYDGATKISTFVSRGSSLYFLIIINNTIKVYKKT